MKKNNRYAFTRACLSQEDMQKLITAAKQKDNQAIIFKAVDEKEVMSNRNKAYKFLL